jgi:hypothetical protein
MSSSQTSGHLARLGITPIVQTLTSVVAWNGSCSPAEPRSRPRAGNHQDKGVSSCLSRSESQSRLCLRSASLLRPPLHLGFIRAAQSRPIDRLVQHPEVSSTATRLDQAFFSPPAHGNKVTRIATTQTDPSRRQALRNGMKVPSRPAGPLAAGALISRLPRMARTGVCMPCRFCSRSAAHGDDICTKSFGRRLRQALSGRSQWSRPPMTAAPLRWVLRDTRNNSIESSLLV